MNCTTVLLGDQCSRHVAPENYTLRLRHVDCPSIFGRRGVKCTVCEVRVSALHVDESAISGHSGFRCFECRPCGCQRVRFDFCVCIFIIYAFEEKGTTPTFVSTDLVRRERRIFELDAALHHAEATTIRFCNVRLNDDIFRYDPTARFNSHCTTVSSRVLRDDRTRLQCSPFKRYTGIVRYVKATTVRAGYVRSHRHIFDSDHTAAVNTTAINGQPASRTCCRVAMDAEPCASKRNTRSRRQNSNAPASSTHASCCVFCDAEMRPA